MTPSWLTPASEPRLPVTEELMYELLDAHADTIDFAEDLRIDPRWAAHLDYLRALQQTCREALGTLSIGTVGR